jgi:hypothetical protein
MTAASHEIHWANALNVTSLYSAEGAVGNRPSEPRCAVQNGAKMEKGI